MMGGVVCKQFADDIKVYRKLEASDDTERIQKALDCIFDWSCKWNLPLAPEKTVYMRIGSSTGVPNNYRLDDHVLTEVSSVKDLGFHYDNKLDFSDHYAAIFKKAIFRTFQVFKGLAISDKDILLKAYKTYIRPVVECGTSVFCPYKVKDIQLIEKIQDNFTRKLVIRSGDATYGKVPRPNSRNKSLQLHCLWSRRKVYDVCMVFKLLTGIARIDASKFYAKLESRARGGKVKISYATPRTNIRRYSFTCRAGTTFISIKSDVPLTTSTFALFKLLAKKKLLSYN
nr:similar to predicted protein [Haemonchus contortus]